MKIVKREKVPTAYKHEIVGIVCDEFHCKKRIGCGDYYYDVTVESDTGEASDYTNYQYCEDCALEKAGKIIKGSDLNCDITFVRRKLYEGLCEDFDRYDEEDLMMRGWCWGATVED